MVFSAVKNFVEKNQDLDKRISSLKGKIKDSFQVQINTSSASFGSWGGGSSSPGGSGGGNKKTKRDRAYQLNFEQSLHQFLPPPLPVLAQIQKDAIMKQVPVVTDYAITPFSFYFEEIEEAYPVPNALVDEDDLPQIPEPSEGMHPYGFDTVQYNARKTSSPVEDVKPNFLKGNPNPMKTFNQTAELERVLSYQDLVTRLNLNNVTYICIADYPLTTKTKKLLWKKIQLCPLIETLILKNVGIGGVHKQIRLPNLRFCDLSQNRIKTLRSIRKITKYSKLLEVFNLTGNPLVREGSDYFLRLHAALPVLETISQKQTPVEDRIKAITFYGGTVERGKIEHVRWALNLDNVPDIRALRPVHPGWLPQNLTQLIMSNSQIRYFYVGNMVSLRHLDLSGNLIYEITTAGFEKCDNLSVLNLSNNVLLRMEMLNVFEFTPSLRNINLQANPRFENYQSVSFFVNDPSHSRSTLSKEYRARLLTTVIAKNRNLMLIDSTPISYLERVDAYTNAGFPREVVEKYRFFLALTVNCTMHFNREIQPDQVEIGKQYDPVEITGLRRLRDWHLTSEACNFSYFFNVTDMDLSNNLLVDIANIGLQTLVKLQRLSLINNQIQTPIPIVAQILDQLVSLETFAIRANPIMQSPTDRLALIGSMATMKQLDQTLKVIDTEITIFDKVEGWKVAGGSTRDAETFKLSYITSVKQLNLYENTLVTLELADCSLEYLDLTPFINLKALLLPNNRFSTMDQLQSLKTLKDLFALDLRYNELKFVDDIKDHVLALPSLQVVGLMGNPFTAKNDLSKYRVKLLSHITPLFQTHRYPLCILDTTEILPEEITEAATIAAKNNNNNHHHHHITTNTVTTTSTNSLNSNGSSSGNGIINNNNNNNNNNIVSEDKKELSFNISILRRALFVSPPESLTELDLGSCGLSHLFLQRFPNLVVLNLSDNLISDNNLKESGINVLQSLKALDIRNNRLKDLGNLGRVIDLLNLEILFIEENTCYDKDNEKDRIRFFKKLTNTKILGTMKFLNGTAITTVDVSKFGKTKRK
ncbi:hypothetical protein DFA_04907 [Cavenderia fasciculata]|uniref:Leucine-rich repeat-containing protein n=1 Tax=Cavenderia fasciculata TaxID=261658 RepID=F4PMC7_CACFS|nr:uncharacterized protein DFA_04907 [Cavenderia fasciculata]EGG22777.1 hypothetical protein DFA_04907 [Cavenderia fasciculata]|eukprot:XP_004360628.1 hypothetical protein DFA_04907 [Cavenderia fasciculata]